MRPYTSEFLDELYRTDPPDVKVRVFLYRGSPGEITRIQDPTTFVCFGDATPFFTVGDVVWVSRLTFDEQFTLRAIDHSDGYTTFNLDTGFRVCAISGKDSAFVATATNFLYSNSTNTWATGDPITTALTDAACFRLTDFLHVVGGAENGVTASTSHLVYDTIAGTWEGSTAFPVATIEHAAIGVSRRNRGYVFGGGSSVTVTFATTREWDGDSGVWITRQNMPTNRIRMGVGEWKDTFYAIAGETYNNTAQAVLPTYKYHTLPQVWSTLYACPLRRYSASSWSTHNRIYLNGGVRSSVSYTETVELNPVEELYTLKSLSSYGGVRAQSAGGHGDRGWVCGGNDAIPRAITQLYDRWTNTWTTAADMAGAKYDGVGASFGGLTSKIVNGYPTKRTNVSGHIKEDGIGRVSTKLEGETLGELVADDLTLTLDNGTGLFFDHDNSTGLLFTRTWTGVATVVTTDTVTYTASPVPVGPSVVAETPSTVVPSANFPDDNGLAGYILEMKTGEAMGKRYAVVSNTTTSVTIAGEDLDADGVRVGDVFAVTKENPIWLQLETVFRSLDTGPSDESNAHFRATLETGAVEIIIPGGDLETWIIE